MAIQHGKAGGVYRVKTLAGAVVTVNRIAETTTWSVNPTREFGEIRKHGQNWVTRLAGINDWTASCEAILNPGSNQTMFVFRMLGTTSIFPSRATCLLALYINGNNASGSATLPRWQGTAWVAGINAQSPSADLQTVTIDFVGQGTLNFKP